MALPKCSELGPRGWAAQEGPRPGHGSSLQLSAVAGREHLVVDTNSCENEGFTPEGGWVWMV